ncbi:MAG: peptidase M16 [Chromatiales bacterium]|nr:peptidase M16 [Chromatiales bacterium]
MSSSHFESTGTHVIEALNLTLESYRHRRTGARHIHLAADDSNNAFLVAFLTVPSDSTGVAHILEHTSLCGSERYPVRDPFFNMLKRSLNTFMNAFTSSDWTAYPFASQNPKDFDNLLQVYVDAAFFPKLDALDFAQDGHRLESENRDQPDSPLVIKGVVYNEMKGAMSPPVSQVQRALQAHLFPTTTYHHNSGGDPENIPELTHEQLLAFHARHYHPSNALFVTYGDFPVSDHQKRMHDLALSKFDRLDTDLAVGNEHRLANPVSIAAEYAVDGDHPGDEHSHVVMGWLLGDGTDARSLLEAYLLQSVLLEHGGSPLRAALETTDLGDAPSELCGLDDSTREMTLTAGLEGTTAANADAIEALILGVLESIVKHGVPAETVRSSLHQLELSQREVGGDHFPYGLNLMLRAMGPALHGGDPVAMLDIEHELELLGKRAEDKNFIPGLVRTLLLDNGHRVRLVMSPSTDLTAQREQAVRDRLREMKDAMSAQDRAQLVELAGALEQRQDMVDDADCLPSVGIEDVPEDVAIPTGDLGTIGTHRATWFGAGTNGLVYSRIITELPTLGDELGPLLPLYCDLAPDVDCAGRDYQTNQAYQASVVGGIDTRTSIRGAIDNPENPEGFIVVAGKALTRNHSALSTLLVDTLSHVNFDELARVREMIAQMRVQEEARITDVGHSLALAAASASINATAALNEQWTGLSAIKTLKALDNALNEEGAVEALCEQLRQIAAAVARAPRQLVIVSESKHRQDVEAALAEAVENLPAIQSQPAQLTAPIAQPGVAWLVNTQVNFCAKAYPCAPQNHDDAAALYVLSALLRNEFLHREVREKGGAYGGGASYDASSGGLGFYSYRDPRLIETPADFDRSIDWATTAVSDDAMREQAILGVIGAMDRPGSPAGEALSSHLASLHGRTPQRRKALRARILDVSSDALRRAINEHLSSASAHVGLVTNRRALESTGSQLSVQIQEI